MQWEEEKGIIAAKKSLGQNFLVNAAIADLIVETGEVSSRDTTVEIGPGKGFLTSHLLSAAREVVAIEKDERLVIHLNFKFKDEIERKKLILISRDVLTWDPEEALVQPGGYKLIANIPYYITGAVLRKFLEEKTHPSLMVLMLQKEVAERIVEKDGKGSMLSISVKAFAKAEYIETVPAFMFSPSPNVDSAIIKISEISKKNFEKVPKERFFAILKAGFSKKRKKLSSNLSELMPQTAVIDAFTSIGLSDNVRAEELSVDEWLDLTKLLTLLPQDRENTA